MTAALVTNIAQQISSALSFAFGADNMGKLDNYGRLGRLDAAIKALFSGGAKGVFFDRSDLSTMFQDSVGTIPVTADGQPVGLALDKSQGLALGPDIVQIPLAGASTGSWTIDATGARRNGSSSGSAAVFLTPGGYSIPGTYQCDFDVADFSGDSFTINTPSGNVGQVSGNGHYRAYRYASGGTTFTIVPWAGTPGEATITNISCRLIAGNHATAPNSSSRPQYRTDGTYHWLQWDGVDDVQSTAPIDFTGTDKMSVFVGIQKIDNTAQVYNELSAAVAGNPGSFYVVTGADAGFTSYASLSRGSAVIDVSQAAGISSFLGVDRAVISAFHDIPGDLSTMRRNTVAGPPGTGDKGTGNFGNYPLFIGSRSGPAVAFHGNDYQLIVVGKQCTSEEIAQTEAFVNGKTGAY